MPDLYPRKTHLQALGSNLVLLTGEVLAKQREQKTFNGENSGSVLCKILCGEQNFKTGVGNIFMIKAACDTA